MTVRALVERLTPPDNALHDVEWPEAERRLGVSFTVDYKELVDTYGEGAIGSYIELFNPRRPELFERRTRVGLKMLAMQVPAVVGEEPPFPPYPGEGNRLLPVIHHADGQYLSAVLIDGQHDDSTYWFIDSRMNEYAPMSGPLSELLLDLFPDRDGWQQATVNWRIDDPVFTPRT